MKKQTVEYYCDDCKKIIFPDKVFHLQENHLCTSCLYDRVQWSILVHPLGRVCEDCKGTGTVKDFYGPHNDYNYVNCEKCNGNGKTRLGD